MEPEKYDSHIEVEQDRKDPLISDLSPDARLPQLSDGEDVLDKRIALAANTAAKMMRAAHHGQTALNKVRLFPCTDNHGQEVPPDPLSWKDSVSIQILKKLAKQVEILETTPLGDNETELDRNVKVANILSLMTRQQQTMEQSVAKAVGMSTKAQQEAAKLQFQIQAHKEKMDLLKDKELDAVTIERIANGD